MLMPSGVYPAKMFLAVFSASSKLQPFGWYGVVVVAVWSVVDEISKIPVPGRHASAVDSLLNLGGCMLGMVVWVLSRSA